jgi:hypothetical protein
VQAATSTADNYSRIIHNLGTTYYKQAMQAGWSPAKIIIDAYI